MPHPRAWSLVPAMVALATECSVLVCGRSYEAFDSSKTNNLAGHETLMISDSSTSNQHPDTHLPLQSGAGQKLEVPTTQHYHLPGQGDSWDDLDGDDDYYDVDESDDYEDEDEAYEEEEEEGEDEFPFIPSLSEELRYYGPRDRFWRHAAETKTLMLGGVDYYQDMTTCLNKHVTEQEWTEIRQFPQPNQSTRRVGTRFVDQDNQVMLVEILNTISEPHARAVQALSQCVREIIPDGEESRPLYQVYHMEEEDEDKDEMGGNSPTHINSMIGMFLPEVLHEMYVSVQMAFDRAGWQKWVDEDREYEVPRHNGAFCRPQQMGLRTSEILSYNGFKNLAMHKDGESNLITYIAAFSDASDYEGGEFMLVDDFDKTHRIKPARLSGLAFLGGQYMHGVDTILRGTREVFASEFWNYPDIPLGTQLCTAEPDNMEWHVEACNDIQFNEETDETDYSIPCDIDFGTYTEYGVCHTSTGVINVYDQENDDEYHDEDEM